MLHCYPHTPLRIVVGSLLLLCYLTGCQITPRDILWALQNISNKDTPVSLPPRPLKSDLPSIYLPAYQVVQNIASVDAKGWKRLQLWVTTTAQKDQLKYVYRELVTQYQSSHDILWIDILDNKQLRSQGEWFAPYVPPYQRYSRAPSQERYAGVAITYP